MTQISIPTEQPAPPSNLPVQQTDLPLHLWDLSSPALIQELRKRRNELDAQRTARIRPLKASLDQEQLTTLYALIEVQQELDRAQGMLYALENNRFRPPLPKATSEVPAGELKALKNELQHAQNALKLQKRKVTSLQLTLDQALARVKRLQAVNVARTERFSALMARLNRQELRLVKMMRRTFERAFSRPVPRGAETSEHPAPFEPTDVQRAAVMARRQAETVKELKPAILDRLELEGQATSVAAIQAGLVGRDRDYVRLAVRELVISGQVKSTAEGVTLVFRQPAGHAPFRRITGGPQGMAKPLPETTE